MAYSLLKWEKMSMWLSEHRLALVLIQQILAIGFSVKSVLLASQVLQLLGMPLLVVSWMDLFLPQLNIRLMLQVEIL